MDAEQLSFVTAFRTFLEEVVHTERRDTTLTPLGEIVERHLGTDVATLPVVTETLAGHRLVDADLALAELGSAEGSRLLGVSHGQARWHERLPSLLSHSHAAFGAGTVDYQSVASGPRTTRQVVDFGLHLFHLGGEPVAVLQRSARPDYGQPSALLEVLASDPATADRVIRSIRDLMLKLSVLRGQVLSLTGNEYGAAAAGATFLERPTVSEDQVVLPEGVLDSITRHVVGIGEQRERLLAAGQHLKRGVLLYGPPGTGKTLTVRHLLASTPGTTACCSRGRAFSTSPLPPNWRGRCNRRSWCWKMWISSRGIGHSITGRSPCSSRCSTPSTVSTATPT